jgi:hypothetical protein
MPGYGGRDDLWWLDGKGVGRFPAHRPSDLGEVVKRKLVPLNAMSNYGINPRPVSTRQLGIFRREQLH